MACSFFSSESAWGPLAVVHNGHGPDALASGVVRMEGLCVYLEMDTQNVLLVWPSDRTRWEASAGQIMFTRSDDRIVSISSGQRLSVGGGHSVPTDDWVAAPNALCPTAQWFVSDVLVEG